MAVILKPTLAKFILSEYAITRKQKTRTATSSASVNLIIANYSMLISHPLADY